GVAAALAEPVERALNLACTSPHSSKGIGHCLVGVVMGMNTDVIAWDRFHYFANDLFDLVGQCAPVGVAKYNPARAFLICSLGTGERVFRICFVAVEEMLAIEEHLPALRFGGADAVADR